MMPSRQTPPPDDDVDQSLKRREALRRSLRECTTGRLTHFNPCSGRQAQHVPTLTSRVQWNTRGSPSKSSMECDDNDAMKKADTDSRDTSLSPVLSEIDELDPSDDDQPVKSDRPSTAVSAASYSSLGTRLSPSCSDSSDTERRRPNFPGNRDIIDNHFPSASPSPPTQHSTDLETPSPVSDAAKAWPSTGTKSVSSLDLHLHPGDRHLLRDERLVRVGSWRVESSQRSRERDYSDPYRRHDVGSYYDRSRASYLHYSPSVSSSSTPPSPLVVLPPIQSMSPTMPVNTGDTPGVMHWRFRESLSEQDTKTFGPARGGLAHHYDDGRLLSTPSQSLPPLSHIGILDAPHLPPRYHLHPPMHPPEAVTALPQANPTRNKNAWKEYARVISGPNEQTEFRCVWRVGYTGEPTDHCGYTAKRHLVKRHIETRHLQFKDHICPYCSKAFPQRVSLMIHVNRHTGAKPHPCRYVDCDKTFSDPARRHKHMVEAHGYNPQGPRKRHRTVDSYHTNKTFETLSPWETKGESSASAVAKA